MSRIQGLRNKIERQKGKRDQLLITIDELGTRIDESTTSLQQHEQAREVVREVGLITQQSLQYHISDITSLALEAVFEDPYELVAEFVQRRNKTECDLYFSREGNRADPEGASGVGAMDVAAFALRVASWSMQTPKRRNVIILDEPFKYLDKARQPQASQMLKEISDRLGIQFIIVTHESTLAEYADKTFTVGIRNRVSKVIES